MFKKNVLVVSTPEKNHKAVKFVNFFQKFDPDSETMGAQLHWPGAVAAACRGRAGLGLERTFKDPEKIYA